MNIQESHSSRVLDRIKMHFDDLRFQPGTPYSQPMNLSSNEPVLLRK